MRCTDGTWCIDDLCRSGGQTLCGLDRSDFDLNGEQHDPLDDLAGEDWDDLLEGEA